MNPREILESSALAIGIVTTMLSLYTFNNQLDNHSSSVSLGKTYSCYFLGEILLSYGAITQRQRRKIENIQFPREDMIL
ncbi:MAG: hypothetical protein AABX66_04375 [Nanoarchaeota archaeon]